MKSLNQKDSSFLKFQNIQCGDKSFIGDKRISWNGKEAVLYFCRYTLFLQPIKLHFIAMNSFVEHENYIWSHVYIIIHAQLNCNSKCFEGRHIILNVSIKPKMGAYCDIFTFTTEQRMFKTFAIVETPSLSWTIGPAVLHF